MVVVFRSKYLLGTTFHLLPLVLFPILFANAGKAVIGKPRFTYHDHHLVKITFEKGINHTLYVCCNSSLDDPLLAIAGCGSVSFCPNYSTLSVCTTRGQEVCCEVDGVQDQVKMQGYVAWFDGKTSSPLSETATYVTNSSRKKPQSVSVVQITRNLQGLNIHWSPLTDDEYSVSQSSSYQYCVQCKAFDSPWAKAVSKCVKFGETNEKISSQEVTAASNYQCCVHVENLSNNQLSEETCQNITTSEQAPSGSPIIICGNDTVDCPSVIRGTKRDITILFKPPIPEERNGKIIHHVINYRNVTAGNFTDGRITRLVVNGSLNEAGINNADTDVGYDVFMRSCTAIGCSSISNTVHIPQLARINTASKSVVVIVVPIVVVGVLSIGAIMIYVTRRKQQRERAKQLPALSLNHNTGYEYPNVQGAEDEHYEELRDDVSLEKDVMDCTVVVVPNPVALNTENV